MPDGKGKFTVKDWGIHHSQDTASVSGPFGTIEEAYKEATAMALSYMDDAKIIQILDNQGCTDRIVTTIHHGRANW